MGDVCGGTHRKAGPQDKQQIRILGFGFRFPPGIEGKWLPKESYRRFQDPATARADGHTASIYQG
jgi:hypothetical protein